MTEGGVSAIEDAGFTEGELVLVPSERGRMTGLEDDGGMVEEDTSGKMFVVWETAGGGWEGRGCAFWAAVMVVVGGGGSGGKGESTVCMTILLNWSLMSPS